MQALVLDFDGVIADSARESFAVSLRTYLDLCPDSPLRRRDPDELYAPFLEAMPLGNGAEDYGVVVAALEQERCFSDQETYDAFRKSHEEDWLATYHHRFYEVRRTWAKEDPTGWIETMQPYPSIVPLLHRRAQSVILAIATAKDRFSVDRLMRQYGIEGLFPAERVMDKSSGPNKTVHLQRLQEQLNLPFEAMTFVDDKVNHLDDVAPLGVRCALAAWGYNDVREQRLAGSHGYLVCDLEDVETKLFSG